MKRLHWSRWCRAGLSRGASLALPLAGAAAVGGLAAAVAVRTGVTGGVYLAGVSMAAAVGWWVGRLGRRRTPAGAPAPAPVNGPDGSGPDACAEEVRDRTRELERARMALLNIINDLRAKERTLQQAREEMSALNHDLEAMVAERTAEVQRLLDQKDGFIRRLGHDLKTPLTPLMALLPMVAERLEGPDRSTLDLLLENARYMRDLVDNTLTLANIGAGEVELHLEPLDLGEAVSRVLESMQVELDADVIEVDNRVAGGLRVRADRLHLRGVLENLLSNARKYMGGPGRIVVEASADGPWAFCAVTDTGMGMTPEQLHHAFDEFYKADESRHDRSSTGLGLSICRNVLQRHGGTIHAESAGLGEGTTVRFSLPLASAAAGGVREEAGHAA